MNKNRKSSKIEKRIAIWFRWSETGQESSYRNLLANDDTMAPRVIKRILSDFGHKRKLKNKIIQSKRIRKIFRKIKI